MNQQIVHTEAGRLNTCRKPWTAMNCEPEHNERYLLWRRVTGGGRDYEYIAWIVQQFTNARRDLGLHQHCPIPRHALDAWLTARFPAETECPVCYGDGEVECFHDVYTPSVFGSYGQHVTERYWDTCSCCGGTGRESDTCHAGRRALSIAVCFDPSMDWGPIAEFDQTFDDSEVPF